MSHTLDLRVGGNRGAVDGDGQTGRVGEDGLQEPRFDYCRVWENGT